jgi:hypothetical protein
MIVGIVPLTVDCFVVLSHKATVTSFELCTLAHNTIKVHQPPE